MFLCVYFQNGLIYLAFRDCRYYYEKIMKAIVYSKYGSLDVLNLEEVPKPFPLDGEVLVRIHASSINDWDWGLVEGKPFVNRLLFGLFKPKLGIPGCDMAGTVETVGKNVSQFKAGDKVFGDLSACFFGTFAEYVCAPENALALMPKNMTFVQAASIPQAAMLAAQGLIDAGHITNGQKILINGAGGGVGTFALQIAKTYNAELTGVDKAEKLDMLRSIGFDHVIDYKKEDFTKNGLQYDLILDVKTNRPVFAYCRALKTGGTYVTVGGAMSRILQLLFLKSCIARLVKKTMRIAVLKQNKDLTYIGKLFTEGKLKPVIDGPFPLEDFRAAFMRYSEAAHKGKVVFTHL